MSEEKNHRKTAIAKTKRQQSFKRSIIFFGVIITILLAMIFFQDVQLGNSAPNNGEIWVHYIDVGQGDSILIRSAENAVLIDGGTAAASNNVVYYLEELGITTLDYVVATHPHSDHIGGLSAVFDRFTVRELWLPDVTQDTNTFERFLDAALRNNIEVTTVLAGDLLSAGKIQMTAVAPNANFYANTNDYSIVLHMQHGNTAFLFTGDAEELSENEIIVAGFNISANVLKVGHHGSTTSSSTAFLDAVNPNVAVIQVGAGNQFGHPNWRIMERLEERGIEVFRTDELGNIVIITDGNSIYLY
ncbi:MAG: MBL fold metallo-hydrolase [Firmicutes bacterium]|nr:MBL fold metallo-hydrolase [Bacillota bacterium]